MTKMLEDPEIMATAMTFWKDCKNRVKAVSGPTREELIALLETSVAA
jgi:hypothetical protein